VGGILLMNFPVSYLLLYLGFAPESTLVVAIVISQICLAARLWFLRSMVQLPVTRFINEVYLKAILVTVLSAIAPYICYLYIEPSITRFVTICSVSIITSALCIYYVGCNKEERNTILKTIIKIKKRLFHR
jgi:hypothetical protein